MSIEEFEAMRDRMAANAQPTSVAHSTDIPIQQAVERSVTDIPSFVISAPPRTKKTGQKIIRISKKGAKRCPVCNH